MGFLALATLSVFALLDAAGLAVFFLGALLLFGILKLGILSKAVAVLSREEERSPTRSVLLPCLGVLEG